ncbi:MAG: HAD family hydrolase [Erysipelotrichaceae bacterium]|nr:HAD family hydrolase [Erysipelotrichaceae bacterium]
MKLPKIIIFDVGGTLIKGTWQDSILGYTYLYDEVLDVKESLYDYLDFVKGMFYIIKKRDTCDLEFNFKSFFNYLKDLYGLKTNKSFEEIEYTFARKFYSPMLNDNVIELLEYLNNKKISLYVLSNSMYSTNCVEKELEEVGIRKYFLQVISSGDHLVRKPSPELFKLYLKKFDMMGYKVTDVCYIGNDAYFDITTPVKLGMKAVHISNKDVKHDGYLEISNYLKLIEEFDKDE